MSRDWVCRALCKRGSEKIGGCYVMRVRALGVLLQDNLTKTLMRVNPIHSLPISTGHHGRVAGVAASSLEEKIRLLHPWGEEDGIDLADSLTSTEVVTRVPLGLSVGGISLDLSEVRPEGLDGLDLPVWVILGSLDDSLLSRVGIIDLLVLSVIVANGSILDGLWLKLRNGRLDGLPVSVLDGLDEGICLIGEGLVRGEASIELGLVVDTVVQESGEDTGLEVGWGGGGNSVLSLEDSEGSSGEHF